MCLAMLMVVMAHKGGAVIFSDWFPYNYRIPFFMFLAGYLFKEKYVDTASDYLLKKVRHLVLPYYKWNLIYAVIVTLLLASGLMNFAEPVSLYNFFVTPFVHGHQYALNLSAWFVLQLFTVQVIYLGIAKLKARSKFRYTETFVLLGLMALGLAGVWGANHHYHYNDFTHFLYRTLYFLPWFHAGWMYRYYWEAKDEVPSVYYFGIILVIQYYLLRHYPDFGSMVSVWNQYPTPIWLAYASAVTAIAFWLRLGRLLAPVMIQSSVIRYIGNNTCTIMMHHLTVFFVINIIFYYTLPITHINHFDVQQFHSDIWYTVGDWRFRLFYSIAGVALPLLLKYGYETKIKSRLPLWLQRIF